MMMMMKKKPDQDKSRLLTQKIFYLSDGKHTFLTHLF